MFEDIKKRLLSGLGAALLTKEKMEEITGNLVDEAKLSKQEAERVVEELSKVGTEHWAKFEENLSSVIQKGLENIDVAGEKDIEELRAKIKELEAQIEALKIKVDDGDKEEE